MEIRKGTAGKYKLRDEAQLAVWPTPVANDDNKTPEAHLAMKARMGGGRKAITSLQVMSNLSYWPTATSVDRPRTDETMAKCLAFRMKTNKHSVPMYLGEVAALSTWVAPSARDWKDTPGMTAQRKDGRSRVDQLPRQALLTASGPTQSGSPARTGERGRLDPAFCRWLMGLPLEWDDCAPTETASSLRKRRSSSERT